MQRLGVFVLSPWLSHGYKLWLPTILGYGYRRPIMVMDMGVAGATERGRYELGRYCFAPSLAVATSAQAMSPAPLHQQDGTDHASPSGNCGAGMKWNNALGRCATTSARRHVRRGVVTGGN